MSITYPVTLLKISALLKYLSKMLCHTNDKYIKMYFHLFFSNEHQAYCYAKCSTDLNFPFCFNLSLLFSYLKLYLEPKEISSVLQSTSPENIFAYKVNEIKKKKNHEYNNPKFDVSTLKSKIQM